jgi:exonuclease SbcC
MKITLKNFRCWDQKELELGEEGLTLLSGQSGAGKSTILMAIYFALFGVGKKISSKEGKTKVILEIKDLKIERTKRPNRLIVKNSTGEWQDDVAQSIINNEFGSHFDVSCYLNQQGENSFVKMSPIDKLLFLEKFSINDFDIQSLKKKLKHITSVEKENWIRHQSSFEMVQNVLNECILPEPPSKSKPIEMKDEGFIDRPIEQELWETKTLCKEVKNRTATVKNENMILNELQDKLSELQNKNKGDVVLSKLKHKIKMCSEKRKYTVLQEQLEDTKKMIENEIESSKKKIEKRIDELQSKEPEYSCSELKKQIENIEIRNQEQTSVNNLKNRIDKLSSKIKPVDVLIENRIKTVEELKGKTTNRIKVFNCPCCSEKVVLSSEKSSSLEVYDPEKHVINDTSSTLTVEELRERIIKIDNALQKQEFIQQQIKELEDELKDYSVDTAGEEVDVSTLRDKLNMENNRIRKLEKLIERRDGDYKSSTLIMLEEKLHTIRNKIDELPCFSDENEIDNEIDNEDELRNEYEEQKRIRTEILTINNQIENTSRRILEQTEQTEQSKKEHTLKWGKIRNPNKLKILLERQKLSREWIEWEKEKQNWDNKNTKVTEERIKVDDSNKRYTATLKLKEKILRSESLILNNMVENINIHAQEWLDLFFPDTPLHSTLKTWKTNKKGTKPTIDIEIQYKDREIDVNSLSGGEFARLTLAYTLALSDVFKSPLIMLDECTASLDEELSSTVFDSIKDKFSSKLALIIAHQVVKGDFDTVINL